MSKLNKVIFEKFEQKINTPLFDKISKRIDYPISEKTTKSYKWVTPTFGIIFSLIGAFCISSIVHKNMIGHGNTSIESPTEALTIKSWDEHVDLFGTNIFYELPMFYNSCDLTEVLNFSVNSWNVYDGTELVDKEDVPLNYGTNDFVIELSRFNSEPVSYNITVNVGNTNEEHVTAAISKSSYAIKEDDDINIIINTVDELNNFLLSFNYNTLDNCNYDDEYFNSKALILKSSTVSISDIKMIKQENVLYISYDKGETIANSLYFIEIPQELKHTFNKVSFNG